MIPKYLDPGYMLSDSPTVAKPSSCKRKKIDNYAKKKKISESKSNENSDRDPLREALLDKENYQHIRAMPLDPGEFVIFTHRILHWGSKGRKNYAGPPRISLSVAFSDPSFEAPYFAMQTRRPSFELR